MRKSMLLALATHFETSEMSVINSWISDNGFESQLLLADEANGGARRVLMAAEESASRAEKEYEEISEESSDEDE